MTPVTYLELLAALTQHGYRNASFHDFDPAAADLILRHDVDVSLDMAMRMGELDVEAGWRSTFFVLMSSEFYNPASAAGRAALQVLREQGHEIGLHFDAAAYADDPQILEDAARAECGLLADLLGAPVRVTAFHRPGTCYPRFLGMPGPFAGLPHAYEPRFFIEAAYVSDGVGFWSHGHPLQHAAIAQRRGMQLLTHPYLWLNAGVLRDDKIREFIAMRTRQLQTEAVRNFRDFGALPLCGDDSVRH